MIHTHTHPSSPTPSSASLPPAGLLRRQVQREVARLAPELSRDCDAYRVAVLLLAALEVGHNIDRLARLTGYRRELVARCARQLHDNGVWRNGETVALWSTGVDGDTAPAFWTDVATAQGKLHRRIASGGQPEWAPPGAWWKHYEYVAAPGADGVTVHYRERVEPQEEVERGDATALAAALEATDPEPDDALPAWASRTLPVPAARKEPELLGLVVHPHRLPASLIGGGAPDAVWLG